MEVQWQDNLCVITLNTIKYYTNIKVFLRIFCLYSLTKRTSVWRWYSKNACCKNSDYCQMYHSDRTTIYIWQDWSRVWNKGSRFWIVVSIWNPNGTELTKVFYNFKNIHSIHSLHASEERIILTCDLFFIVHFVLF